MTSTDVTVDGSPSTPDAALAHSVDLCAGGRWREAIDLLTTTNHDTPDPTVERELVRLRHEAFVKDPTAPATDPPPWIHADPVDEPLPELRPEQLTIDSLRSGIARHGCVLVRGLIPPEVAAELADGIDQAMEAFDSWAADGPDPSQEPWFARFSPLPIPGYPPARRQFVRSSGGVWAIDSPRMLFRLTALIEELGLGTLIAEYLGEPPALSANKCNLRRVPAGGTGGGWHQDGAFLGRDVRSMNLWLSLSTCGTNAATMDVVPRRLDELAPSGTEGATFPWSVAPSVVEEVAGSAGVVRPHFEPGDAMLFDHMFLHRTAATPDMTEERYAIESWFFAPSTYPEGQIPFVL